jgi:hypothetical protein
MQAVAKSMTMLDDFDVGGGVSFRALESAECSHPCSSPIF